MADPPRRLVHSPAEPEITGQPRTPGPPRVTMGRAVVVLYGLILVLAVAPAIAQLVGLTPLQAASIGLILLVVLAHGITWEFMMETPNPPKDA